MIFSTVRVIVTNIFIAQYVIQNVSGPPEKFNTVNSPFWPSVIIIRKEIGASMNTPYLVHKIIVKFHHFQYREAVKRNSGKPVR